MKPGVRTTEFWLTIGTNILGIVALAAEALPPKYGVPTLAALNALYAVGRSIAKYLYPNPEPPIIIETPPHS
jgi:hypothetical protein